MAGIINDVLVGNALSIPTTTTTEGQIIQNSLPILQSFGNRNFFIGFHTGNFTTTGTDNFGFGGPGGPPGFGSLRSLTTGASNLAIAHQTLDNCTTGIDNTAIGGGSLFNLTTGDHNTVIGGECFDNITTGSSNIGLGYNTGHALTAGDSSNIFIGYNTQGTAGDNNTLRIGNGTGAGPGSLNKAFIHGVYGITPASGTTNMVIVDNNGQFGSQAIPSGGITTINGDTGSVTGDPITFDATTNAGRTIVFSGSGTTMSLKVTDANANTLMGAGSASSLPTGSQNTFFGNNTASNMGGTNAAENVGFGAGTGFSLGAGASGNTLLGHGAGVFMSNASSFNTIVGHFAGEFVGQSNRCLGNVLIGQAAGNNYNGGLGAESYNIAIGYSVLGTTGESNTLRIGNGTGTGAGQLNASYIAGIDGVNVGSVAKVVTMASDQLGTATITAGTNISVTPGANTITIAALGGGAVAWSVISANQTAAVNNGYFCNKGGTLSLALPAVSAVGDVIKVTNENTALGVQFTQAAGQQILIGNTNTTLGATGTLTSSAVGDTLEITCKVANTIWRVTNGFVGNWTPA